MPEPINPDDPCPCGQRLPWHLFELGLDDHTCSCERHYVQKDNVVYEDGTEINPIARAEISWKTTEEIGPPLAGDPPTIGGEPTESQLRAAKILSKCKIPEGATSPAFQEPPQMSSDFASPADREAMSMGCLINQEYASRAREYLEGAPLIYDPQTPVGGMFDFRPSFVKTPVCEKCKTPMAPVDDTDWACPLHTCEKAYEPVHTGVYPVKQVYCGVDYADDKSECAIVVAYKDAHGKVTITNILRGEDAEKMEEFYQDRKGTSVEQLFEDARAVRMIHWGEKILAGPEEP